MKALYTETLNTGLPSTFTLESGAFRLIGGTMKADDNLLMMLNFEGGERVYFEDFPPSFMKLLQRPTSFVNAMKVSILGGMYASFRKYLVYLTMQKSNIVYDPSVDRKQYSLIFQYKYNLQPDTSAVQVKKITL